jgi:ribosome-associated protein
METFRIKGEYIQLNQLLKVLGWCDHGSEANEMIDKGEVVVNGITELRKRNKIYPGMVVEMLGKKVRVDK